MSLGFDICSLLRTLIFILTFVFSGFVSSNTSLSTKIQLLEGMDISKKLLSDYSDIKSIQAILQEKVYGWLDKSLPLLLEEILSGSATEENVKRWAEEVTCLSTQQAKSLIDVFKAIVLNNSFALSLHLTADKFNEKLVNKLSKGEKLTNGEILEIARKIFENSMISESYDCARDVKDEINKILHLEYWAVLFQEMARELELAYKHYKKTQGYKGKFGKVLEWFDSPDRLLPKKRRSVGETLVFLFKEVSEDLGGKIELRSRSYSGYSGTAANYKQLAKNVENRIEKLLEGGNLLDVIPETHPYEEMWTTLIESPIFRLKQLASSNEDKVIEVVRKSIEARFLGRKIRNSRLSTWLDSFTLAKADKKTKTNDFARKLAFRLFNNRKNFYKGLIWLYNNQDKIPGGFQRIVSVANLGVDAIERNGKHISWDQIIPRSLSDNIFIAPYFGHEVDGLERVIKDLDEIFSVKKREIGIPLDKQSVLLHGDENVEVGYDRAMSSSNRSDSGEAIDRGNDGKTSQIYYYDKNSVPTSERQSVLLRGDENVEVGYNTAMSSSNRSDSDRVIDRGDDGKANQIYYYDKNSVPTSERQSILLRGDENAEVGYNKAMSSSNRSDSDEAMDRGNDGKTSQIYYYDKNSTTAITREPDFGGSFKLRFFKLIREIANLRMIYVPPGLSEDRKTKLELANKSIGNAKRTLYKCYKKLEDAYRNAKISIQQTEWYKPADFDQ